ncbi:hypothetical protein WA026_006049 [Henosepilachna vigintioctopunctata]|uniref:Nose resistant-to-fluoxetine protein N-terminal domain-containing protein n=1 Tax=Henosepilachna vigintioctopunctata TaxID=420089 RepID=A0AAW1THT8_9CUCU
MKLTCLRVYLIFLCGFLKSAMAFNVEINNMTVNLMDIMIPTVYSDSELCRNHSSMYLEQLSKFTVWATDMFDASTKFPNGIFYGSSYNTGNFDECVKVRIPEKNGFSGQHCMAHFKLKPEGQVLNHTVFKPKYDYYENIYNMSTWEKLAIYEDDMMKIFRDETYVTFCIPSTCSYKDLENSLRKKVDIAENLLSMKIEVDVNRRNCQVERESVYSRSDMLFVSIIAAFILFEIFCTAYHVLTNSTDMEHWKFSGKIHQIFKAFSYSNTMKKITAISYKDDGTYCMHGFKVLATLFVISGHRIMFTLGAPQQNPEFFENFFGKFKYSLLHNAPLIVDSFLTISGFLACYLILWEVERRKKLNILMIYLHRLIRLTPVYAVFLGFYCTIFYHLGEGPFWEEIIGKERERCRESWWTNILYINNYVDLDKSCMFHSWYLSADTQLFLIVPIFAYLLWKNERIGLTLGSAFIGVSVVVHTGIVYLLQEDPFLVTYMNSKILRDPVVDPSFQRIHIPSHLRISSYFVGAIGGFIKFKLRTTDYKIPKSVRFLCWIFCVIIMFAIISTAYLFYIPQENKNFIVAGLYSSLHRFFWALCTTWCIIGVSEGHGQLVAPLLNWKSWRVLSRITYTSYLTHGAVHLYNFATMKSPVHLGRFSLLSSAFGDVLIVYTIGLCLSLVFESPILELENMIFKRKPEMSGEQKEDKKLKI